MDVKETDVSQEKSSVCFNKRIVTIRKCDKMPKFKQAMGNKREGRKEKKSKQWTLFLETNQKYNENKS